MTHTTDKMADITKGTDKQIAYATKIRESYVSKRVAEQPKAVAIINMISQKLSTSAGVEAARKLTGKDAVEDMAQAIADKTNVGSLYAIISSNDASYIIDNYRANI